MKHEHHSALPAGTLLGDFRLESVLGQGGFGITYLAHDTTLERPVAVKEYLPVELAVRVGGNTVQPLTSGHVDTYGWGLARFLEEARTLARFRHPNIVRVIRVMEQNGTAYMVMEYEQGRSLDDAVKFRKVSGEGALRALLVPLLDGLEHVHASGFVHRDIKPANIMLREDGTPVLIDFGSARQSLGAEARTMTALVTEGYAPFEQYNASPDDDRQGPWTDIYSLAATLYGIVTGKPPVSALVRANALLEGKPDPVAPAMVSAGSGYSPGFLSAIDRALAFRASDRPQSVAEWRALLEGGADTAAGLTVLRDRPAAPGAGAAATAPHTAPGAASPAAASRRGGGLVALLVVVVLAAVAAGGWYWWQGEQRAQQMTTLLERAADALAADRLLAPAGDNAASLYREALSLEPGNEVAASGLAQVENRLMERVGQAIGENRLDDATRELELAADLRGGSDAVDALRARLAEARAAEAQRLQMARTDEEGGTSVAGQAGTEPAATAASAEPVPPAAAPASEPEPVAGSLPLADPAQVAPAVTPEPEPAVDPVPARVQTLQAEREIEAELNALLERGDEALAALRLTSPADDNAVMHYRAALDLVAGDARAIAGLERVVQRYVELADNALAEGEPDRAATFLERAESVRPESTLLAEARARVATEREAAAQRTAEAEARAEAERLAAEERAAAEAAVAPGRVFRDALQGGGEGPQMVVIAGASFDMGSPTGEAGREADETRHPVSVAKRFAMGRHEVTFDNYDRFARATGRNLPPDHGWGRGRQPVIAVNWEDANAYAAWLSSQTGQRYRLPTEAEWEYAASGGSAGAYWWGNGAPAGRAVCAGCGSNSDGRGPAPVGSFDANPMGLHDTAGNVWEWTCSSYDAGYGGAEQTCATQRGGSRAIRGGAYLQRPVHLRSANRSRRLAHERLYSLGFRVLREF